MSSRRGDGLSIKGAAIAAATIREAAVHQLIFENLPVADVSASRKFFTDAGYSFNEQFCDDRSSCMVLGDSHYAMLLNREFFGGFTDKPVSDARAMTEVLVCLSANSRQEVDALVDRAVASGGTEGRSEDHGFMYGRSYADLDGHIWEILWMDPSAVPDEAKVS